MQMQTKHMGLEPAILD